MDSELVRARFHRSLLDKLDRYTYEAGTSRAEAIRRLVEQSLCFPTESGKAAGRQFGAFKGKIALDARFDEPLPEEELDGWNPA